MSLLLYWFQLLGINDFLSILVSAGPAIGAAVGGGIGGCIGDRLYRRWSKKYGRTAASHFSITIGACRHNPDTVGSSGTTFHLPTCDAEPSVPHTTALIGNHLPRSMRRRALCLTEPRSRPEVVVSTSIRKCKCKRKLSSLTSPCRCDRPDPLYLLLFCHPARSRLLVGLRPVWHGRRPPHLLVCPLQQRHPLGRLPRGYLPASVRCIPPSLHNLSPSS